MKMRRLIFVLSIPLLLQVSCKKDDRVTVTGLPEINVENNKPVGTSAHDLLSSGTYKSVKIEVQYMPGYAPDATALTNLLSFYNSIVNKPAGVSIIQSQVPASGITVLSLTDIALIEKNNRTVYTNGTELGVYVLYTDAGYSESNVLGLAFRNTSICILGKTIRNNSGGIGQTSRTKLESAVLEHEAGHIFGLVDVGSPMQTSHKDAAHGNHCSNTSCLMYYSSETTDVLGFLLTGNVPPLDADCKADLHANGGR